MFCLEYWLVTISLMLRWDVSGFLMSRVQQCPPECVWCTHSSWSTCCWKTFWFEQIHLQPYRTSFDPTSKQSVFTFPWLSVVEVLFSFCADQSCSRMTFPYLHNSKLNHFLELLYANVTDFTGSLVSQHGRKHQEGVNIVTESCLWPDREATEVELPVGRMLWQGLLYNNLVRPKEPMTEAMNFVRVCRTNH